MKQIKLNSAMRLGLAYLGVLMVLSLSFSFAIYNVSNSEFRRQYRRPEIIQMMFGTVNQDLESVRGQRLEESSRELKGNLVLLNFVTLIGGGLITYGLAKRTLKPIEDALESQGRFTSDASHELRTPLAIMRSEIEVALMDKKLDLKQAKNILKSNLEEVQKLGNLSDNLLKLSRNDYQIDLSQSWALSEIVGSVIDKVSKRAEIKKIKIEAIIGAGKVFADNSLSDALVAIADNAIKYSSNGSTVTIKAKVNQEKAIFEISDSGIGISQKDLPRIFDRFYRADNSRQRAESGGHGLGLAMAKKIIDAHNGEVQAMSKVKKGTTIKVLIPNIG